ncbi:MAG: family 78 glycoside hydrolase catalytic domain [Clostridia bacterium]|nr:family 78 glycoside hydrolase catalytic domain [Clostridia bacterium]
MNNKNWITAPVPMGSASCVFAKTVSLKKPLESAALSVSAIGLFEARIGGKKVGKAVLTPGYTAYDKRLQYMTFDVTDMMSGEARIEITGAPGWAVGKLGWKAAGKTYHDHYAVTAELSLCYADGTAETVVTDGTWEVFTSPVLFSDIYDGETVDYTAPITRLGNATPDATCEKFPLVPQLGEDITEHERLAPVSLFTTPKGERVLDFGQNMTGYVELTYCGKAGDRIELSFAEVLDREGNFYTENYRSAKNKIIYVSDGTPRVFKPRFSFQGFRYVRLDSYPAEAVEPRDFRAIAVHSDMARTGRLVTGNAKINQLYHNTVWGQKSNYLDLPTDCPQRDERLGWTGDAQVFCRTAAYNYDVRKFFEKWLADVRAEQREDGAVLGVVPSGVVGAYTRVSAAWGDCATVIPWELYCAYGDKQILCENFNLMKRWVDYQHSAGAEEYLWLGGYHYGDWLAMDAGPDVYMGATSTDLIASAFFYHSADLVVKAGEVLGEDVADYRTLRENVRRTFRDYFMENGMPKEQFPATSFNDKGEPRDPFRRGVTQTALVLILHFGLCDETERPALVSKLVELIEGFDGRMTTGFVGTPYILHVLTAAGRTDLAYRLLFEERNPSWLYSVTHGATTMWEHWNSQKEDGSFWSTSMNSFNHYAYGSVCDWIYGVAAGITFDERAAGYRKFTLAPHPDKRLGHINCALDTVCGRIESNWYYKGETVYYEFTVPQGTEATVLLPGGYTETVGGGTYHFAQ